jgi:glycosyltransferase involved in cell wall biosynthesis
MSKPTFAISCPVDTYSGYGARSRDLVNAIIQTDKYEVIILSQRWGNTRFGYLQDHNDVEISKRIIGKLDKQPDIWMQITVPNEFQRVGKYNIGCTAGMETTVVAPKWLEGCNTMDLILTSSTHSMNVFKQTKYDIKDKDGKKIKDLGLEKEMLVLFEGVDTKKYKPVTSSLDLSSIKEQFCYLTIGHWMQGDTGEDRKNMGFTVKAFLETFKNKSNPPALILKTQQVGSSIIDQGKILDKINKIRATVKGRLPNIYLLHGDLTDENINQLYNHSKVKVMLSLAKGEGFGRPLLEFTTTGKPIIASGWSGQCDFLNPDMSILVGGQLTDVHPSAQVKDMILEGSKWFTPDPADVGKKLKDSFKHYKKFVSSSKKQRRRTLTEFTYEDMATKIDSILEERIPKFPKLVELKLPKL